MSKPKHTPGPWNVFLTPSGHQYIEWWPTGKRCEGVETICEADMVSPENPNAVADARLIAAAPELLYASKRALEIIKAVDNSDPRCIDVPGATLAGIIGVLVDAIAKAEGEE